MAISRDEIFDKARDLKDEVKDKINGGSGSQVSDKIEEFGDKAREKFNS